MLDPITPAVAAKWLLPAAREIYKNRTELSAAWKGITQSITSKRHNIVVTGAAGSGKSVLFDHLRGVAPKIGYVSPSLSEEVERGKLYAPDKQIAFNIIPGQDNYIRREGLGKLFDSRRPIHGIIHVICNGYVNLRDSHAQGTVANLTDFNTYLQIHREMELKVLEEVLGYVVRANIKYKRHIWLLLAVSKYDLYYSSATNIAQQFSFEGSSSFIEMLGKCEKQIGINNFRWDTIPVATLLDQFQWSNGTVRPIFTEPERDHFLAGFAKTLEKFCGNPNS